MDYKLARMRMVDSQVRPNDVTDLRIQTAMENTPREIFLPVELRDQAYVERELNYADGRSMITARDLAKLIAVSKPKHNDLTLNAVCGSGYSTAILAQLVEMVVAVESDETLGAAAQEHLNKLNINNAAVISGDPVKGAADQGPFDLIFLDMVIEKRPQELLSQLKDGGRLAAIFRDNGVSSGVVFKRSGDSIASAKYFDSSAKTPLPGLNAEKAFVF
ncbi:protein-L-isoaspartate O-methyltransferase [Hyphococcus flavus]|uniref:Protein-L-isoaspartate O-methyltransferase n=1 Tax=Hyphococcus flavus TaxID=1866326 RepID=A0AAE9ZAE6_9PROT|nr:protein-L-isoaspartate O-methyltransferase [Hyphococcus flavus]WDI30559.1 protein-L-isoaspartate O-methyltransferase [Hyphococcus flavus]